MATKVIADPDARIIDVVEAPSGGLQSLDVQVDIYSGLKDDWQTTAALQQLRFPFRSFGDFIGAGRQIGPFVFFDNSAGWRIRPYDVDHDLTLTGNLVGEAAVLGLDLATWLPQAGRTIVVRDELSSQALTLQTGISGLTAGESAKLTEFHQAFGLDAGNPVTHGDATITFAGVTLTLSQSGADVIVTRS